MTPKYIVVDWWIESTANPKVPAIKACAVKNTETGTYVKRGINRIAAEKIAGDLNFCNS